MKENKVCLIPGGAVNAAPPVLHALYGWLGEDLDTGGVFCGGHPADLLELPAEVMYGCISEGVCYLGEVHPLFPYELFGCPDFQA